VSGSINHSRQDAVTAIIFAALITSLSRIYVGDSTADDTYIYMRYADNYLSNGVASFNIGERSHGITSVLWFVIGTVAAHVAGNQIEVWKHISLSFYFTFTLTLTLLYLRIAKSRAVAAVAVALVLADPFTFRWSSTGMENALVATSILFVLALLIHRKTTATVFACALLPLVRPELIVWGAVAATIAALATSKQPQRLAVLTVLYIVGILISLAINAAIFGAIFPQTAEAKALALKQSNPAYALVQMLLIGAVVATVPMAVVAFLSRRSSRALKVSVPDLLLLGTLAYSVFVLSYAAYKNHLVSTRYSTSYVLPLTMVGLAYAVTQIEATRRTFVVFAVGGVLQASLLSTVLLRMFPGTRTDEGRDIAAFVTRCIDPLPPNSRIAISEVGAIAYYSDRYVIDLVGLTDLKTLQYLRAGEKHSAGWLTRLLTFREATHYIDPFAFDENAARRVGLGMVAVCRGNVARNNVSSRETRTTWVLYELKRR
jgi:arabinofuranosyltransferase